MYFSHELHMFLALIKTIHMHLLLLLVVSIIFGFCMIRNAELQSCLLTPFKGVIIIVVMKIYRML